MPELPDITVYIEHLERRLMGEKLERVRLASPFVLRSVEPPLSEVFGKIVRGFRRMGKRIVFMLDDELFLIVHLMVSGRFRWKPPQAPVPGKIGLAAFDFAPGTLVLTEAATKKRASIHMARGDEGLAAFDRGGLEVLEVSVVEFSQALRRENHTLKRALTDPELFSGIGNAYSDEILHRAKLSPVRLTQQLTDEEQERLFHATRETLVEWTQRLTSDTGDAFPENVTAFREEMAVHGKYRKPCRICGTLVQRIVHAENETNYCPRCQTGGRLLADRALSKLLKKDWPRSIDELEQRQGRQAPDPPPKPKPSKSRRRPG